jgi:acetoin utilization deacetylase AcuC-like enzyme
VRPRLFFCDHYDIPLPPGHKFPIRKYRLLRDRLDALGRFDIAAAGLAPLDRIRLIHDPEYVASFVSGTLDPAAMRRIGFPWSESMMHRTLASVGGTLLAAEDAIERGFGGVLAGGTHHAFPSYGAGFCVFNDIAVAIASLRDQGRIQRAAVVDLDVHQGDGTAAIFAEDPDVLTLSLHGRNNFPFRKQDSKIDLAFEDGTGDEEYLEALAEVLPEVARFEPDVVFYQSGVDALEFDTLGKLRLTLDGLRERDRLVFDLSRSENLPVAVTMGGGYSDPIDLTVQAHAQTYVLAAELLA